MSSMTGRDRIALFAIAAVVLLIAVYLLLVSPERKEAGALGKQVDAASAQLSSAESQLSQGRAAQARYATAYAQVVSLGKAVPASQEVPSLIYQLAQASNQKHVDFSSITTGASTGSSGSSSPSTAAVTSAGFTQMPFTFVFNGSFNDLFHMFQQLNRFTTRTSSGGLEVSGRLLTIQSTKLSPASEAAGSGSGHGQLTGTVTATAYVLPSAQGLTGGATASSPSGGSSTPASSSTSAGSAAASAVVIPR